MGADGGRRGLWVGEVEVGRGNFYRGSKSFRRVFGTAGVWWGSAGGGWGFCTGVFEADVGRLGRWVIEMGVGRGNFYRRSQRFRRVDGKSGVW